MTLLLFSNPLLVPTAVTESTIVAKRPMAYLVMDNRYRRRRRQRRQRRHQLYQTTGLPATGNKASRWREKRRQPEGVRVDRRICELLLAAEVLAGTLFSGRLLTVLLRTRTRGEGCPVDVGGGGETDGRTLSRCRWGMAQGPRQRGHLLILLLPPWDFFFLPSFRCLSSYLVSCPRSLSLPLTLLGSKPALRGDLLYLVGFAHTHARTRTHTLTHGGRAEDRNVEVVPLTGDSPQAS